jgi:hypothetical protein
MGDISANGTTIIADTFDMQGFSGTGSMKVDVLIYNTINGYGWVLSSVVFVSDPKELDDVSPIVFRDDELLTNINIPGKLEDSYTFIQSGTWATNKKYKKMARLDDVSGEFDISSNYAPIANDSMAFDGWYTVQSRGPKNIADPLTQLVKNEGGILHEEVVYALDDNGNTSSIYEIVDQTQPVYNIANVARNLSYDLFAHNKTLALYSGLLTKVINRELYSNFLSIKSKLRTIDNSLEQDDYATAQYMIQSMDLGLISELI